MIWFVIWTDSNRTPACATTRKFDDNAVLTHNSWQFFAANCDQHHTSSYTFLLSTVHSCQKFVINLFWTLLLVSRTFCHTISHPHHLCQFSEAARRPTSFHLCSTFISTVHLIHHITIYFTYLIPRWQYRTGVSSFDKKLSCWLRSTSACFASRRNNYRQQFTLAQ